MIPTVSKRVTSIGSLSPKNLGTSCGPPQKPCRNPQRDPALSDPRRVFSFSWWTFPDIFLFFSARGQCPNATLGGRHLSVLNLKFDFISDGGCTREEQIALSQKRHLFPHGGREPKAFWICFSRVHPPSEIKSNFKFTAFAKAAFDTL